jgi:hypothetical protein
MSALINQARTRVPRLAEAAVDRARLTVVPRRAPRAPRMPFVTLVCLVLLSGVAGLLLFNTSMQQASFTATALETRANLLAAKEQSLQMELENLRDPQRVGVEAREMGMVPPSNPAFISLEDGAVLGEPTAATSLDGIRVTPRPTLKPMNLRPRTVIVPAEGARNDVAADGAAAAQGVAGDGTTGRAEEQGRDRSTR